MADAELFVGDSELASLMRRHDWEKSAVGTPSGWPRSLRTVVQLCLGSRYPITIFWGPEFVQFYNDAYRPVLGASKHPSALGAPGRETWPEIWPTMLGPMFAQVVGQGISVSGDDTLFLLERYGYVEETYFNFSYDPIRDDDGRIAGVFVACQETTDRVIGERRLTTLGAMAEIANEARSVDEACGLLARRLAENAADVPFAVLYLTDADGNLSLRARARVDERAAASCGAAAGRAAASGAIAEQVPLPEGFACEPAEGRPPPVDAVVLPLTRPGAAPAGVLVIGRNPRRALDDRTREFLRLLARNVASAVATARAYEDASARAAALAELDRAKTVFFSNVSHELRTPLTLMLGPLEELLHGGALPPATRERLELAHRNGERLARLVNTLLDFSRIEAGRIDASYVPTELAAVTRDLASMFRSAIEKAGLRLVLELPPLREAVHVDREMWEKIVLNLLSNALKFTFEGEIFVGMRETDARVTLVVRDTGVGIAPEELPRVFDRFHRVKQTRSRTHEGTGIGLSLVQELAKLHGGEVRVSSEVGRGTTFEVSIPKGVAHLPAERIGAARTLSSTSVDVTAAVRETLRWLPSQGAGPAAAGDTSAGEARILLADDNADMRDYLARLLAPRWAVQAVADGKQALDAARAAPPDLVVADVMMPELDGFALMRELRADPRTREAPVVLLSARAGEEAKAEGLAAGANAYLVKPFSARELLTCVDSQLALSRAQEQARKLVDEERQRFFELLTEAPVAICVVRGEELVLELANRACLEIWGKTPAVIGKPLLDGLPEIRGQGFDDLLHLVMRTGKAQHGYEKLARLHREGAAELSDVYFDFVYAPVPNANGPIDSVFVVGLDVSGRVVARAEAERSLARYRALFEHALDGILVTRKGEIVQASPALCALYGRKAEEIVGHDYLEFVVPEEHEQMRATRADFERSGRTRVEYRVRLPDGHTRRLEALATASFVPGETLSIVRDVEERSRTEGLVRFLADAGKIVSSSLDYEKTLAALARACVGAIADWVTIDMVTPGGGIERLAVEHADPAKTRLAKEIARRLPPRLDDFHGPGRAIRTRTPELTTEVDDALLSASIQDPEVREMVRSLGLVSSMCVPLVAGDEVLGALSLISAESGHRFTASDLQIAEELARRASVAIEHARLYEQAREASRTKDIFLATVSHELRTPLNAILGWSRMLRAGLPPERVERAVETIERNAFAQVQLVEDLLDISRIVSGKMRLDVQPVALPGVIQGAIESLRPAIEAKGLRFSPIIDPKAGPIAGDERRLQQVVWNLLSNAIKFTPKGGRVQVVLERVNSHVEITVSDTGQGMAREMVGSVFERFRQADSSTARVHGGLGLGLAISKHIIELHGGTIEALSEGIGRGASFVVKLPMSPLRHQTRGPLFIHPESNRPTFEHPKELIGLSVLVVDDEPDARALVAEMLTQCGCAVLQAGSAREALRVLDQATPHLIVSDVGMPEQDGYELMQQIRARPRDRGGRIPAAALTAYASAEDRRRALRAGFQMHIAKPVEPAELVAVLANLAQLGSVMA